MTNRKVKEKDQTSQGGFWEGCECDKSGMITAKSGGNSGSCEPEIKIERLHGSAGYNPQIPLWSSIWADGVD